MAARTTDSPKVTIDLNHFERPDRPNPCTMMLGTKRYVLRDIMEVAWQDLVDGYRAFEKGNPRPLFSAIIEEKDHEAFFAKKLPLFKLQELYRAYNAHFGIVPEKALGSPSS